MRQSQMVVISCLVFIGLLSTACSGSNSPASSEANRVATRVAEELSVAATLTALAPPGEKPTTPAPTDTVAAVTAPPAQTAVATPAQIATEVTAPTDAPPAASCRVITAGLNLRPGPGTVYNPPLAALGAQHGASAVVVRGTRLPERAMDRSPGRLERSSGLGGCGTAIRGVQSGSRIAAGRCAAAHTDARADGHALLPTAPAQVAVVPVDGSDGNKDLGNDRGVNQGRNLLLPGFASYEVAAPMVFRDKIVFRAEVFDRQVGQTDGAGIDSVTFTIRDETGDTVHERTERNPGYCVFGGGEPDCTVWRFSEHGNKWPGGAQLQPGVHDAQIVITPKNGDPVTWFWSFRIEQ